MARSSRPLALRAAACWLLGLSALPAGAGAQPAADAPAQRAPLGVAVDRDDDDDNGVVDAQQAEGVPVIDLAEVMVPAAGDAQIATLGGLRVIRRGRPVETPFTIPADELPAQLLLQATAASMGSHSVALLVTQAGSTQRYPLHAVELSLLDARNRPLSAAEDALSVSHRVTNDRSLPRNADYDVISHDPDNVRVQILDSAAQGKRLSARLESVSPSGQKVHGSLDLTLSRPKAGMPFRSRFVRLVGDDVDRTARGVAGQVLRVGLRDHVRITYRNALGEVRQALRVGRPGREDGPLAARRAVLRTVILRAYPGGPPVIGVDEASAVRIVREELALANDIWLQCHITFGSPEEAEVVVADPPASGLLSIGDGDGLPARGGAVQFRVDGVAIGPVPIPAGSTPLDTGLKLAQALRSAGFGAQVTVNPPAVFGAGPSADVLVRRGNGELGRIDAIPGVPLTTDTLQRISLGSVDLGDGLEEFDNMTATSGTLEERTLIKALSDDDPSSIEVFIVNRFEHGTRQGEAFIAASSGPVLNSVVLDRNGLRQRKTAWTLAHELGHVLLNQPLHPDNVGADVPSLLMDSDNNRGTVHGPKRLLASECLRVRHEAGTRASPPLLTPYAE